MTKCEAIRTARASETENLSYSEGYGMWLEVDHRPGKDPRRELKSRRIRTALRLLGVDGGDAFEYSMLVELPFREAVYAYKGEK
jgi:hypothetical protein